MPIEMRVDDQAVLVPRREKGTEPIPVFGGEALLAAFEAVAKLGDDLEIVVTNLPPHNVDLGASRANRRLAPGQRIQSAER